LFFFFSFFISAFVLCLSGFFFFFGYFSVFDSALPLQEIDVLFLFPILVLLFVIVVPQFFVLFSDLNDLVFEFVEAFLFVLFPGFVLFVVALFLFGFFCLVAQTILLPALFLGKVLLVNVQFVFVLQAVYVAG